LWLTRISIFILFLINLHRTHMIIIFNIYMS
jgi:hypothetical protein